MVSLWYVNYLWYTNSIKGSHTDFCKSSVCLFVKKISNTLNYFFFWHTFLVSTWHNFTVMLWLIVFHCYVSLAHGEKHEELVPLGSPDSHTVSEGQKSSGTAKTRKGKERSSEKEKAAKEKQTPRFEPQVSVVLLLIGITYKFRFIESLLAQFSWGQNWKFLPPCFQQPSRYLKDIP